PLALTLFPYTTLFRSRHGSLYTPRSVSLHWKILRLAMYPALVVLGAGCSGINVSKSVSPATFLLPGFMQADPPPASLDRVLPARSEEHTSELQSRFDL